jgi:cytochrome c oxidase subunit II
METRSHLTRVVVIWFVVSLIGDLLVVFAIGSNMPPGRASAQASDQTTANLILSCIMFPIGVAVCAYFVYTLWTFRDSGEGDGYGAPIRGHRRTEIGWVAGTAVIVIALAIYGTYALYTTSATANGTGGAGGGQGPSPSATPSGTPLQVQVIGQQWHFTYRYPQYGGVETFVLELPAGRTTELHVTSLDVVHSFWAYQLGVKADAVPGSDNIAYVTPSHPMRFTIRCAELCGLWHGEMHAAGRVVTSSQFASWIAGQRNVNRYATHFLPHYGPTYFPVPYHRAG